MTRNMANNLRSFLYGFSGAGLFRKLVYPGAPNEFVDSRTLEQIRATGEIDENVRRYKETRLSQLEGDARRRAAGDAAGEHVRR